MLVRPLTQSLTQPLTRRATVLPRRLDELRALIDSLFGNGEQGLIWLPMPTVLGEQALWQQSDGTVIVNADGDPIGRGEEFSGNDNDLTQPTSADRPLYKTDGSKHWAQFDGAGDYIEAREAYPAGTLKDEIFIIAALKTTSGGANDGFFGIGRRYYSTSAYPAFRIDRDRAMVRAQSDGSPAAAVGITTSQVTVISARARRSDGSLTVWQDGALIGSSSFSSASWFTDAMSFQIGYNTASSSLDGPVTVGGELFAGMLRASDTPMQDSERESVEAFFAKLAGITL